jgi:hypothetical protein
MHHVYLILSISSPSCSGMARPKTTLRKATGPHGVPCHQLAPRHEGNSSGSNDPIGDLEAKVARLTAELRQSGRERASAGRRIAELSGEVERLQRELEERAEVVEWTIES